MGFLDFILGNTNDKKNEDDIEYKTYLSIIEKHHNGSNSEALTDLTEAIKNYPNNPHFYYIKGTIQKILLKYKDAIPYLEKAIELNLPDISDAYFNLAMSRFHTQDLDGARKDLDQAEELGYSNSRELEDLDEWIEEVRDIGYESFMSQWD